MPAYATESELYVYGAPQKAFGQLTIGQINGALESASRDVDTYLRARFALPLAAWDSSVTESACRIAAYNLLSIRGYNPASGSDVNIKDRYDAAIAWLVKVQKQQAHPDVSPVQLSTPVLNQPVVISSSVVDLANGSRRPNRGW